MRNPVQLTDAAYMAGGLGEKVQRLLAEREAAERAEHQRKLQRARERRATKACEKSSPSTYAGV